MLELMQNGYPAFFSPWMLSAFEELQASSDRFDLFNWYRVSPYDVRIRDSNWLAPQDCKSVPKIYLLQRIYEVSVLALRRHTEMQLQAAS
jgi:hypothetical protein